MPLHPGFPWKRRLSPPEPTYMPTTIDDINQRILQMQSRLDLHDTRLHENREAIMVHLAECRQQGIALLASQQTTNDSISSMKRTIQFLVWIVSCLGILGLPPEMWGVIQKLIGLSH